MPVFVVVCEGTFFGYGSYGPFRPYEGYAQTVEHSIYVKRDEPPRDRPDAPHRINYSCDGSRVPRDDRRHH